MLHSVDRAEKNALIREVLTPFVGELMVTPKDVDLVVENLAKVVANGINIAIQPDMELEDINKFLN